MPCFRKHCLGDARENEGSAYVRDNIHAYISLEINVNNHMRNEFVKIHLSTKKKEQKM